VSTDPAPKWFAQVIRFACPDSYASNRLASDAMGVMYEPVEDPVGQRWITYLFVPAGDWQLRG
jgi:hypothetical protein